MDKTQTTLDLFEPNDGELDKLSRFEEEKDFELVAENEQQVLIDDVTIDTEEIWNIAETMQINTETSDFSEIVIDDFKITQDVTEFDVVEPTEDLQEVKDQAIEVEEAITQDLVIEQEENIEVATTIEIDTLIDDKKIPGMTTAFENMVVNEEKKVEEIKVEVEDTILDNQSSYGKVNIVVIGVGGCGCNAIHRMYTERHNDIKLVAIDTSEKTLENISADHKLLIGEALFDGHGSGGRADLVEQAFDDEKGKIQAILENVNMVFLAGGLGRGTGSVGLHRIGNIAREMGILTIGFATIPNYIQGYQKICKQYYPKFNSAVDSTVLVENDKILMMNQDLPIVKAMEIADSMLVEGIRGIYELITNPGKINLDYADITTAFKDKGSAIMGVGRASGEEALLKAITNAIHSEVSDVDNIRDSHTIIFNISCSREMVTIGDATEGTERIQSLGEIKDVFFGYRFDESLVNEVHVSFIATGTTQREIDFDSLPQQPKQATFTTPIQKTKPVTNKVEDQPLNLNKTEEPLFNPTVKSEEPAVRPQPVAKENTKSEELVSKPSFFGDRR